MSNTRLPVSSFQTDPVLIAQQSQPATPKMSAGLIDLMFVGMCRSTTFFDECHRFLKPSHFPDVEAHYRILFDVMCQLRPRHNLFNHTLLYVECVDYVNADPMVLHPNLHGRLFTANDSGLLFLAFTQPAGQINLIQCRDYLQRFLFERVVASPLRAFMNTVDAAAVPTNLTMFLDALQEHRREIQTVNTLPVVDIMPDPDQAMEPPSVFNKTGVDFIDTPLGGQREGDANGILGVTGAGKSTLAAHMGVQMARTEFARAQKAGCPPRVSVIFTYEEDAKKMKPRIWSAAAQIRRDKLERLTNPREELTHAGSLEEYELKIAGAGEDKEGEYERWQKTRAWLTRTLWIADMSGSEKFPNAGSGYVNEITSVLEGIKVLTGGCAYLSVLIDFAGLVCERYQQAQQMDDSRLRHLLKNFGDQCRREISERFRCTTWIFHQIAPSKATERPSKALHHSMAAEAKAFAEFLSLCGCLGIPDPKTGCRLLNWSKTRYARGETVEPVLLRINDLFARFENVNDEYKVDDGGRAFVARTIANRFHGDEPDGDDATDMRASTAPCSTLQQGRRRGGGAAIPVLDPHISNLDV